MTDDQKWLMSTQKKFKKLISSPYWDCIDLSDLQLQIVVYIMNTKNVEKLPPLINQKLTDIVYTDISKKLSNAKQNCK